MTDRAEWERDAVVWLAGRWIGSGDHASDPRLTRAFEAWAARTRVEEAASRFAARVGRRLLALRNGVQRVDRAPELVRPPAPGPLVRMLEPARAAGSAPLVELGVAAGPGRELFDELCEVWVRVPDGLPTGRYLAFRVVGDSMTPLLGSGDTVLVDLDGTIRRGTVAIARHAERGYMVKRVRRDGRRVVLESLNPAHPSVVLDAGEVTLVGPVLLRWSAKPRLARSP